MPQTMHEIIKKYLRAGNLYVDMDDVEEGKSFKVKLDGEELDSGIEFNWLIIK